VRRKGFVNRDFRLHESWYGASRRRALLAEVTAEKPEHLEPTEARALLAATPEPYREIVLAALSTGFRRGACGLRWRTEDKRRGYLYRPPSSPGATLSPKGCSCATPTRQRGSIGAECSGIR
jgi:hypothetical protein